MQLRTLRSHLLVLTLVTLLPMIVFGITAVALVGQRERAVFERGATERTLALLTAVDTELSGHAATLQLLASSPNVSSGDLRGFREDVLRTIPTQPGWRSVNLALPSGQRVLDSAYPPQAELPAVIELPSFEEARRIGRPVVGGLFDVEGDFLFAVRVPVVAEGVVKYFLSALLDPGSVLAILDHQRLPADWVGVVLDRNHRIVARTMNNQGSLGQLASESLRAALNRASEGWFHGFTLEGTEVYTPYNRSSFSGWTVALGIPARAVEVGVRRARTLLALGVVGAVGMALLLATWTSGMISKPISSLAAAAKAVGGGAPLTMPDIGGVSEVRQVSHALGEAAAAVRQRESALRAADRAKDEFLAMLAHELRNPLSALTSAAQVLELTGAKEGPASRAAGVVQRQVQHMTRMVDDLLDMSRVTTGKVTLSRQPMDLAEAVMSAVRALRSAGRLDQHEVRVALSPVWIDADEARVEQIATNLIGNSVKYTPPRGTIDVRVFTREDRAVLEVTDSGMGLSPELLPRVFDLFVQGERSIDRSLGGLGVGLTLVKRLAELHGGSAAAASDGPGRGSRFSVSFPVIEPPARQQPAALAAPSFSKSKRVLLVEDNHDARHALLEALELYGYETAGAHDGPAALEAAAAQQPEVAVIDIGLPGIDGYELARRLRRTPNGAALLLIALTGYGQAESRRHALDAGFDQYVTKPISPEALAQLIEQGLASREA